jgi:Outer membrane protein beta-barrel domain
LRLQRTLALGLFVFGCASAARAQSSVYVSGNVFADLQRGSGQTSPSGDRRDTTVAGGGVRVGGFLSARWSLELGVDAGAATDTTVSLSPTDSTVTSIGLTGVVTIPPTLVTPLPIRPTPIISLTVDERIRTRATATSVLLGYHPPSRGRLQAGFKGGISFVRSTTTITSTIAYRVSDPLLLPILQLPAPTTDTTSSVAFNTAATVAAELAISLSAHAAIVPEMRAFGFGSRVFLRPGAAVRWFF